MTEEAELCLEESEKMEEFIKNTKTIKKELFWDVDPQNIDLIKHQSFILQRVLNYGTLDNLQELISVYGIKKIKSAVCQLKNLSNKSLNFVSFFFSIPKEQLKCYTKKQLSQTHWNY